MDGALDVGAKLIDANDFLILCWVVSYIQAWFCASSVNLLRLFGELTYN